MLEVRKLSAQIKALCNVYFLLNYVFVWHIADGAAITLPCYTVNMETWVKHVAGTPVYRYYLDRKHLDLCLHIV